jgi:hypothetical protein
MIKMGLVRTRDTTSHLVFFRLCRSSYTLGKHPCCEKCFCLLNVSKRKVRDWKTCLSLFICSEYVIAVRSGVSLWHPLTISRTFFRAFAAVSKQAPYCGLFVPSRPVDPVHPFSTRAPRPRPLPIGMPMPWQWWHWCGIDVALWCLMMFGGQFVPKLSKTWYQ